MDVRTWLCALVFLVACAQKQRNGEQPAASSGEDERAAPIAYPPWPERVQWLREAEGLFIAGGLRGSIDREGRVELARDFMPSRIEYVYRVGSRWIFISDSEVASADSPLGDLLVLGTPRGVVHAAGTMLIDEGHDGVIRVSDGSSPLVPLAGLRNLAVERQPHGPFPMWFETSKRGYVKDALGQWFETDDRGTTYRIVDKKEWPRLKQHIERKDRDYGHPVLKDVAPDTERVIIAAVIGEFPALFEQRRYGTGDVLARSPDFGREPYLLYRDGKLEALKKPGKGDNGWHEQDGAVFYHTEGDTPLAEGDAFLLQGDGSWLPLGKFEPEVVSEDGGIIAARKSCFENEAPCSDSTSVHNLRNPEQSWTVDVYRRPMAVTAEHLVTMHEDDEGVTVLQFFARGQPTSIKRVEVPKDGHVVATKNRNGVMVLREREADVYSAAGEGATYRAPKGATIREMTVHGTGWAWAGRGGLATVDGGKSWQSLPQPHAELPEIEEKPVCNQRRCIFAGFSIERERRADRSRYRRVPAKSHGHEESLSPVFREEVVRVGVSAACSYSELPRVPGASVSVRRRGREVIVEARWFRQNKKRTSVFRGVLPPRGKAIDAVQGEFALVAASPEVALLQYAYEDEVRRFVLLPRSGRAIDVSHAVLMTSPADLEKWPFFDSPSVPLDNGGLAVIQRIEGASSDLSQSVGLFVYRPDGTIEQPLTLHAPLSLNRPVSIVVDGDVIGMEFHRFVVGTDGQEKLERVRGLADGRRMSAPADLTGRPPKSCSKSELAKRSMRVHRGLFAPHRIVAVGANGEECTVSDDFPATGCRP